MTCRCGKEAEQGGDECFRCRVSTVGFSFVGGGGYGREAFHERTTNEFINEHVGDWRSNPDIEPMSRGVWS